LATSINADNGAVSGSAGLKSSADSSGVLTLQTNGTTAVTVSASQVVSLTSGLAVTGPTTILKNGGTGATAGLLLSGGGTSTTFNIDYGTVASNRLYFRQNYFDGSGNITFQYSSDGTMASPIDVLAVKWGGGIAVTGLTDISAATSGQIQFPATQNASANANTLDDYEEGTWTPTVVGSSTAGTYTVVPLGCVYTKIGRMVALQFNIQFSAASGGSGQIVIGNLPFQMSNSGLAAPGALTARFLDTTASTSNGLSAMRTSGTAGVTSFGMVLAIDNANWEIISISAISTSTEIVGQLTYIA